MAKTVVVEGFVKVTIEGQVIELSHHQRGLIENLIFEAAKGHGLIKEIVFSHLPVEPPMPRLVPDEIHNSGKNL